MLKRDFVRRVLVKQLLHREEPKEDLNALLTKFHAIVMSRVEDEEVREMWQKIRTHILKLIGEKRQFPAHIVRGKSPET